MEVQKEIPSPGPSKFFTAPSSIEGFFFVMFLAIFIQKQPPEVCSIKKGVLRNFSKLTGKHLCQDLLFTKLQPLVLQLY